MRWKLFAAAFAVALSLSASIASAAGAPGTDRPLFAIERASLGAGLDYAWWQNQGDHELPPFKKAWEAGLYGAYVLTPHFTATASTVYDFDNKWIRYRLGVRFVLWRGED